MNFQIAKFELLMVSISFKNIFHLLSKLNKKNKCIFAKNAHREEEKVELKENLKNFRKIKKIYWKIDEK